MKPALLILSLALFAACATTRVQPSYADEEVNGRELFLSMIMPMSNSGGGASCYSFYFRPAKEMKRYHRVLILSAGHCPEEINSGHMVVHDSQDSQITYNVLSANNWRAEPKILHDFYVGAVVERRPVPTFFHIERPHSTLKPHEEVITVAARAVIGKTPELQKLIFKHIREDGVLVFEAEKDLEKGSSGAPVATDKGKLLGVLVGSELRAEDNPNKDKAVDAEKKPEIKSARLYIVMPIDRIMYLIGLWDRR